MTKSIVKGIGIGFLSCIGIGIGIVKTFPQVLVLVLVSPKQYWSSHPIEKCFQK